MDVFCRKEIKYLITAQQRKVLEEEFARRMKPDQFAHSSIRNIYYDTPDFRLIRKSLEKPVYKEKIRLRYYGEAHKEVFLEMKKKFEGIVYKRRITVPEQQAVDFMAGRGNLPDTQIGRELEYFRNFYRDLQPQVFLSYERDSWCGVQDPGLRITIDEEICYRVIDLDNTELLNGEAILEPGTALMEVKAEYAIPLWLTELLARERISKISFSKYGQAYWRELERKLSEKRGYHHVG